MQDPYNVRAGFVYAHFGWMMVKQDPREVGYANIDDLNADPMIMFQHKYYGPVWRRRGRGTADRRRGIAMSARR